MNWEAIFWLFAMVVFLAAEAATVTLVSIWFAAGALAAIVVALAGGSVGLQVTVFLVMAIILLASLRNQVRKHFTPWIQKTNIDSVIGSVGIVTTAINNVAAAGQVKLNGMEWTARSSSGEVIPAGTQVTVERIEGVKVFVSPVNVTANL